MGYPWTGRDSMYTSEIMRRRIIIPSPGILTDYGHSPWGECIAVVGAAADDPDVMPELICDGIHIHPCMVRNTFRLFGSHRMILISDSMRAVGIEDGQYTLGGQDVTVRGALATLADGTIAGSATNLYDCMCKAVEMGIPKEQAIRAATINPAVSIGVRDEVGSLEAGKYANIVIADKELHRRQVILKGVSL